MDDVREVAKDMRSSVIRDEIDKIIEFKDGNN